MVATDGPLSVEKLNEISAGLLHYLKARGYSQALVVQKVGADNLNASYLSAFVTKKYDEIPAATLQRVARLLNDWMEQDHRRTRTQGEQVFVQTRVATRTIKVVRYICQTCDIGVIHGPAGCGKTTTLIEAQKLIPASIYVLLTTDCSKRTGFLRALREAVWRHRAPSRPTLADIIDRLKLSDRLLMLDNADVLDRSCYQVIMDLHDAAGIPILLCGTSELLTKLTADRDPLRGQMSSRIGMRAELLPEQTNPKRGGRGEWISADEIRRIFERGKIKLHPASVARLKSVATSEIGRLRLCERYLRYATLYAGRGNGEITITPDVLERAIALVDGLSTVATAGTAEVLEAVG